MLEEKELAPKIIMSDLEKGIVEIVKTKLILKDGVELTKLIEHEYINAQDDEDLEARLGKDCIAEVEYIKNLKEKMELKNAHD